MKLKQSILLQSVFNARELGGYINNDGKAIKRNLLLRTGNLNNISDSDINVLKDNYRLSHIIDFRMAMEFNNASDPQIEGVKYHHLDVIDPSVFDSDDMPDIELNKLDLIQMTELSIRSGMLDENMYIVFLESEFGKRAFSGFFRVLLESDTDRAILWHCTGGKDRTGIAAMLLLSALGVDEKTVIEDYLLTNVYNSHRIAATRQYLSEKGCDKSFIDKAVLVFDAVDESFMRNAVEHLKKSYGSVLGYIQNALEIKQSEIDILKEKYLN